MKKSLLLIVSMLLIGSVAFAQRGKVSETKKVKSSVLGMDRNYSIYLPAGYDDTDLSYPVLYLLHGHGDNHTGWVQFGQVQHIADKAIAEGKAGPMIIVMPDADTKHKGYFNLIDGSYDYEDFFFEELIPHIEKTYRVRSDRRYRAISGLSMGGGGTFFYALHRPDMFAAAAPLSAATGQWSLEQFKRGVDSSKISDEKAEEYFKRHNIESILRDSPKEHMDKIKSVRWYISCGDDDFLLSNNNLTDNLFRQYGVGREYRVKNGAHTWSYWRMELPEVMEFVSRSFMQY